MLRTLLIATALLTASSASFAHDDDYGYGRVVSVQPHFVISFGTPQPDGFRVMYESGGYRYWTHTPYYPGPTIVLPPSYRSQPVYYRDYEGDRDGRRWEHRGWEHRGRDGWRDDRWGRYGEHRHHDDDDD